jgi:hypothetical protein
MLFIQSLNFVLWPEQKEKQAVCILQVLFTANERRWRRRSMRRRRRREFWLHSLLISV